MRHRDDPPAPSAPPPEGEGGGRVPEGAAAPPKGEKGGASSPMERLELRMLRARIVRDIAQVVALTAAAAWALYTFWYQASYVPKHDMPNVVLSTSLDIAADRDGFVTLKAKVTAYNPGKASVRLVSESISLVGSRFSASPGAPLGQADLPPGGTSWSLGSGVDPKSAALLASQVETTLAPSTRGLEPNETIERTQVFHVEKRDYDVLSLTYHAVFNNRHLPAPKVEYLERREGPDGLRLVPALPKNVTGSLSYSDTSSRAVVVLAR